MNLQTNFDLWKAEHAEAGRQPLTDEPSWPAHARRPRR
jgi:plasmid maintenance system antidote protein VapI